MKKATYEDFLNLKIGASVVVNTKDDICDFGIFMGYSTEKGTALVADCVLRSKNGVYTTNISEYTECFIVPTEKEELLKYLQRKM